MWLCTNDAFLSIVSKDCPEGSLLVRARRPGDIEKVFGRRTKVTRSTDSDYLYRAVISRDEVITAMQREVLRVDYGNFKDSVADEDLHDAYMKVWCAMAALQNPRPYSEVYKRPLTNEAVVNALPLNDASWVRGANLHAPKNGARSKKNSKQARKAARLLKL